MAIAAAPACRPTGSQPAREGPPYAAPPHAAVPSGAGATPSDQAADQIGKATYYADSLAGNATASGEIYDPAQLTAAHRELPFGTRVEVRRTDTGATVVVRINDRGPFAGKDRIIDVSGSAARALDMLRAGVVPVELRVLSQPAPN